ncbi:hypothetical protein D7V80_11405 [Corallococcus sp. CA054B]|uniref:hypothetical protein n=1 Tax=Corallococcus sp. CA054B TaxID=2316734 RepID=UPI000EA36F4E|nr:hypothetical protein [Corallococcus sp. CA054B]RKG68746.1 hypothetical protein D7V80_11405 [Corallococcus sp. CA054B]
MNARQPPRLLTEDDLARHLAQAYRLARADDLSWRPIQEHLHARRSAAFIEAFAGQLVQHYAQVPGVCVFRKTRPAQHFKRGGSQRSEFLFDVLACVMEKCPPAIRADVGLLDFIQAPLFQMESELAQDTAEAAEDFSKLVCGAAPQSLFVGPLTHNPAAFLKVLSCIAPHVPGEEVYCGFILHPKDWADSDELPKLYRWRVDRWDEVSTQA